jgi:hypothetical protein
MDTHATGSIPQREGFSSEVLASWRESAACRVLDPELFFPIGKLALPSRKSSEPRRSATAAQYDSAA